MLGTFSADEVSHGEAGWSTQILEALLDRFLRAVGFVLADLPLSFQAADRNLEANDSANLGGNVVFWSVGYSPRSGRRSFVLGGKGFQMSQKPGRIFEDSDGPVGVDDGIVPSGDNLAVLGFFRVPVRGDVVLGTGEDRKGFDR